jgi:N-acyl homoserine lactone hydrolase
MAYLLKGKPQSLAILDFGLFQVHANGRIIGIPGALVETDAGERVLIDSGFPKKYADDVEAASEEDQLGKFGKVLSLTSENQPPAQLEKLGLSMADIDYLVITHTHIDHMGNMDAFPDRPIIIGGPERALPMPLYWREKQPYQWPDREYILINQDTEIAPGFTILFVPGHTPGELAIYVELPQTGGILWTSDAISRLEEVEEGCKDSFDPDQALHHAHRLLDLGREKNALVIFGHGPAQWAELKKAPERYL